MVSNYILAESFGRKNYQDRLYYVMDYEDLETLQSEKNIVMGDKAYIIKQGCMVIAGNDGQWYDVGGGSGGSTKSDINLDSDDVDLIGQVSYIPDEDDIEPAPKGATKSAASDTEVTTDLMAYYDFSKVNVVSLGGMPVETETRKIYAYAGGGGEKGYSGDDSGEYWLDEDTEALFIFNNNENTKSGSITPTVILLMPNTALYENPDYNGGGMEVS